MRTADEAVEYAENEPNHPAQDCLVDLGDDTFAVAATRHDADLLRAHLTEPAAEPKHAPVKRAARKAG